SVARLTLAERTPGTAFNTRSTRPTHEAQVMPSITSSSVCCAGRGVPGSTVLIIGSSPPAYCRAHLEASHDGRVKHFAPLDLATMASSILAPFHGDPR